MLFFLLCFADCVNFFLILHMSFQIFFALEAFFVGERFPKISLLVPNVFLKSLKSADLPFPNVAKYVETLESSPSRYLQLWVLVLQKSLNEVEQPSKVSFLGSNFDCSGVE